MSAEEEAEMAAMLDLSKKKKKKKKKDKSSKPKSADGLLKEKVLFKDKKVGIIISGGNVDLSKLPFWQQ